MQLVERHIINSNHKFYKECDLLCYNSKNLYNKANYIIRQEFIKNNNYIGYNDLVKDMRANSDNDFIELPSKVSSNIVRLLDKNWKSYFKSIKDWSKNKSKYLGKPKLPNYKHKIKGRNIVPYEKGAISLPKLRDESKIKLSKTNIEFYSNVSYEDLQSVRIIPKFNKYVIEVIYNKEVMNYNLNKNNIIGIDLGLNNLCTVASTVSDNFIINGKPLKSINQYYNKEKAILQYYLDKNVFTSKKITKLTNKRNNKIDDYLHKTSKYIIDYCLAYDVGTIIVGHNKKWKQDIKIGKRNNQNFVNIPHFKLINIIKYKAELYGINIITTEESYTSKCSFIDNEQIKKHVTYAGRRVKRGLFVSKNNIKINADINGAFNIIKKVVPNFSVESLYNGIEGVAVHPELINPTLRNIC